MIYCTHMVCGAFQDSGFVHSCISSRGRFQGGKCARYLWIMLQRVKYNLYFSICRLQMEMSTFVLSYSQWTLYHNNTINGQQPSSAPDLDTFMLVECLNSTSTVNAYLGLDSVDYTVSFEIFWHSFLICTWKYKGHDLSWGPLMSLLDPCRHCGHVKIPDVILDNLMLWYLWSSKALV